MDILNMINNCSYNNLYIKKSSNSDHHRKIPGWTELVKPYSDKAKFWHQVWLSAGKPMNTTLHTIMKRTRNIYHMQIRKVRRAENKIKSMKLLEYSLDNNCDLFEELKKMRRVNCNFPSSIDSVKTNIPQHLGML